MARPTTSGKGRKHLQTGAEMPHSRAHFHDFADELVAHHRADVATDLVASVGMKIGPAERRRSHPDESFVGMFDDGVGHFTHLDVIGSLKS